MCYLSVKPRSNMAWVRELAGESGPNLLIGRKFQAGTSRQLDLNLRQPIGRDRDIDQWAV